MDHNNIWAEAAIKSVLVKERYFRDSCQWDKFRDTYHPDASKTHLDISWYAYTAVLSQQLHLTIDFPPY